MLEDCVVVFVLGGPGSGKGTHCQKIHESLGWAHLSTGELFRAEVERGTEQGALLRDIMAEGGMVPVEITLGLLQAAMEASPVKRFLIDGFPRALDQVEAFERHVCRARTAAFFDCPDDVMLQRALQRGRVDDTPEAMQKRLDLFREASVPVVELFESQGRLLRFDNSRPVDDVAADVIAAFLQIHEELGLPLETLAVEAPHTEPPAEGGVGDLISFDDGATEPAAAEEPAAAPEASAAPPQAEPAPVAGGDLLGAAEPAAQAAEGPDELVGQLRPVVVVGPSGVGKGTLIARLMERRGDRFGFTVSHTTRGPREGEEDGVHYHFAARADMEADIAAGRFLEHAEVHGNLYGTSVAAVHAVAAAGKCAVLDIDVQGAQQVRAGPHGGHALLIFIAPPSHEELERRLRGRGTETEERVQRRLANAHAELAAAEATGFADAVIVNDDLEAAYLRFEAAIAAHVPDLITAPAASAPADDVATRGSAPAAPASPPAEAGPASEAGTSAAMEAAAAATAASREEQAAGTKEYLRATVVPAVEAALLAVAAARPDDPLQFVIDHLQTSKL